MKQVIKKILVFVVGIILIPHVVVFLIASSIGRGKNKLQMDLDVYKKHKNMNSNNVYSFLQLMIFCPEYRNVFYFRLPIFVRIPLYYWPQRTTLHIWTKSRNIGGGLYVGHGWGTVINAKQIGQNCIVGQNVTIGSRNALEPILGDSVGVYAHAVVLGNVHIGDNVQIGAGAVVVKDVPEDCVVVPSKSIIIKQKGERVSIPL